MARALTILGSTGSVGVSTLQVVQADPNTRVFALSANDNVDLLLQQCEQHNPRYAVVVDEAAAESMQVALRQADLDTELLVGADALDSVAAHVDVDLVMAAIVGGAGLASSMAAVQAGKQLLLANKESLVMSGQLFMDAARDNGATILPIDSEHNAVFQCLPGSLPGNDGSAANTDLDKITLTASGGPFLELPLDQFSAITPEQACKHPRWSMGRKISVDSATMMNKGLELIEASFLFSLPAASIDVLIHPQSIVHSLVHYRDGSVLAQMANPDMRVPIAYGLAYPQRMESGAAALDLTKTGDLQFFEPDLQRFPCLRLGREVAEQGGTAPVILNAANEEAVAAFLEGKIRFSDIALIIEQVLSKTPCEAALSLAIIREVDKLARNLAKELILKD
ncbi:MAG: 1-deoxy-D-xylulose-5-phosphate reductoisomerase [Pseudomonadales bacterium]|nr:1-deoxy-D-xylulose-5-phosphate reductoisomerase [Pseudomonadales bacterium]